MKLERIKGKIPEVIYEVLSKEIAEFRPAQVKAINSGLLEGKNLLVCTPTASGKTLIAELASLKAILEKKGKVVYIAPLKALASEKFADFKNRYRGIIKVALSIGDIDSDDSYLAGFDMIICTAEKLDSLIRHGCSWLGAIRVIVIDEIHTLNDTQRGPVLEILITMLREIVSSAQILGLSATIGNPEEIAEWLDASLVIDDWRSVRLYKGIYLKGEVELL